jgi:hypothetical protein
MSTEPQPLTLSAAVHRAVAAVDPDGTDDAVADFLARFEDRDEPISAVENIDELIAEATHRIDVEEDDPALTLAGAVVTYLAFRRDEADEDPDRLLRLAADAEFKGHPPEPVAAFLEGRI